MPRENLRFLFFCAALLRAVDASPADISLEPELETMLGAIARGEDTRTLDLKGQGFELCKRLRTEHQDVEVVFYTGVDELGLAERAFAVGAQGVVSKGDSAGDLLKAVLLASRGRTYASPAFAARADHRDFEDLSPKQLAALRLLAQGMERKQIAEQMGVGEETVKSHLSEVRRKLGARTSAQAVAIGLINSLFEYDSEPAVS
jgi:DNA-binding NarL/FixJ family response regulator